MKATPPGWDWQKYPRPGWDRGYWKASLQGWIDNNATKPGGIVPISTDRNRNGSLPSSLKNYGSCQPSDV